MFHARHRFCPGIETAMSTAGGFSPIRTLRDIEALECVPLEQRLLSSDANDWIRRGLDLAPQKVAIRRAIGRAALLGRLLAKMIRDLRSCTASTAWLYLENIIRSASQWPWVLRLAAAAGRFAMEMRPLMKLAELRPWLPRKPRLLLRRGR